MGRPKQLLRQDDCTLLELAIKHIQRHDPTDLVVVLGAEADRLAPLASAAGARTVMNEQWREGMGSSLACGAQALDPGTGVLVMLVDQPLIGATDIGNLVAAWRRHPRSPAAASSTDYLGPPALFPASDLEGLRQLSGTAGARRLLRGRQVTEVAMDGALIDIDSPGDLALLATSGVHLK